MKIQDGTGSGRLAGVSKDNRLDVDCISTPAIHTFLHKGLLFTCHYENTVTNTNEMTIIAFNTPVDREVIMSFRAEVSGLATACIYENPSLDAGEGTTLTVYNRNRVKKNIACNLTTIETTPASGSVSRFDETQAADANLTTTICLWQKIVGSALKQAEAMSFGRTVNEWVLEQNQQYAFVVKTGTDDDNVCHLTLNWTEETNPIHGH